MLNGHGDDLYLSEVSVKANFSTNVWYDAEADMLRSILTNQLNTIFHYPEPAAESFVNEAARFHQLEPGNVLAGNGATELFYLIAQAFQGSRTIIPIPSFSEYEDACTIHRHALTFVPMKYADDFDGDLMFICNPNNPDGHIWSREEVKQILFRNPDMVLVVDESFIDFAPDICSCESLLKDHTNLLIVRSLTKNYAIPGLRLGYMLGSKALIKRIKNYKYPWSVNTLAIEVGKFLLQHGKYLLPDTGKLMKRKGYFVTALQEIPGFTPLKSGTSFFLVRTSQNATELKQRLLERYGILIRDASNFRGLDEHYFRINTLSDEKNRMLLAALRELSV